MNKIIIENDKDLVFDEDYYEIEIFKDANVNILVSNLNVKVKVLVKNSKVNFNLELKDNCDIIINLLGIDSSINYDVIVKKNSHLYVVDSIVSKIDSINKIKLLHEGNNSITKFYTNGININNNKMYYYLDGIILKESKGVFLEENSKVINIKDGDSKIIPNLIIDTKDVSANHLSFIGTLNDNDLLYLMSRGIEKNEAKKLLIKSVLLSNMTINTEEFIKEIVLYLNMDKGGYYE